MWNIIIDIYTFINWTYIGAVIILITIMFSILKIKYLKTNGKSELERILNKSTGGFSRTSKIGNFYIKSLFLREIS